MPDLLIGYDSRWLRMEQRKGRKNKMRQQRMRRRFVSWKRRSRDEREISKSHRGGGARPGVSTTLDDVLRVNPQHPLLLVTV